MEDDTIYEDEENEELPYLIFSVKERLFAISTGNVQEMVAMPDTIPIPDAPDYVRGVINLRGNVYKLVDLRLRLGMQSHQQEINDLSESLTEREKEHIQWLNELEACINEDREFTLATDPHECKFGEWYDHFETKDSMVRMEMKKFDEPHRAIHSTAEHCLELVKSGNKEEALRVIEYRKNGELALMIELFKNIKTVLQETIKEIAVVVELEDESFSLAVDKVEAVETIDLESATNDKNLEQSAVGRFHGEIAKRKGTDELVLLIDPAWAGGEAVQEAV